MEDVGLAARHIALREQAGLTQEQEARKAGVSPTTISGIESGKITRPHLRTILRLAQALDVRPEDLTERELPKELAPPSTEPSFNDVLEEERRAQKLAQVRDRYQLHRQGLDRYCDHWEKKIADNDLSREMLEEFFLTDRSWGYLLMELYSNEIKELAEALDTQEFSVLRSESVINPVVTRYFELVDKLVPMAEEKPDAGLGVGTNVIDFEKAVRRLSGAA